MCMHLKVCDVDLILKSEGNAPYVEQQCRYWCVALQMDQTETVREVTLSGANKK